ncbi:MAG: Cell division ATP-binding protein FtsE [Candidatus Dichloromethanomonas elyunquensis]|nr:MAG: Cell division ATP-binding protein FtsE [Candidatus Dichloromethanomonas elyunquensis]
MIEAKGVALRYPDQTLALKNIDLEIQPGELIFITGPSGSGKTSLLKLFLGMEYPTSGYLEVMGQLMNPTQAKAIRKLRRRIGPVFQEFKLFPGRTVFENVLLGHRFLHMPKTDLKENSMNALEKVGLAHKAFSLVENLSWGEHQRVAIARAVARKPLLILADEPTGNLDKENALKILNLLASFKDNKTSVIITTHATHLLDCEKYDKLIAIHHGVLQLERIG